MTKIYNIDLTELENLLNVFSQYADDEDVLTDIYNLKILINRLKNSFVVNRQNNNFENIAINLEQLDKYKHLFSHIKTLLTKGLYFSDTIEPTYKDLNINHDETIELCKEFYNDQGKFFSKPLDSFCETISDRLMFFSPNDFSEGEIHFLKTTGDVYVFSPDYKNIKKASILIHEFEHIIDCYNNQNFYNNILIREISSMFMEMIGCDYISKKLSLGDDNVLRRYNLHSIVKFNALYTYDKMKLLNFLDNNRNMSENDIFKKINKKLNITKNYATFLLDSYLSEDFYYPISYMIAIELFNLYVIDKDKALYVLIDIILNGNDYNIFNILKKHKIFIGNNIVNYEDDMCLTLGI